MTVGIWAFAFLILRGVKEAATINKIVTVAKVIPILVFARRGDPALDVDVFLDNMSGGAELGRLVRPGAGHDAGHGLRVPRRRGGKRLLALRTSGARTWVGPPFLGFLSVLAVFATVTIVSYGIMPRSEIAELRQPSMAGVFEAAVGSWGAVFVSVGLIVSVLGAYLAWTLMAAEVLFVAAKDDDMPRFLRPREPASGAGSGPRHVRLLVQVMLFVTLVSDGRVRLHAQHDQRPHADPVPPRRRVRAQCWRSPWPGHRLVDRTSRRDRA